MNGEAGWDPDADGLFGAPPVEVLIGVDAHSSVLSSLQLIGFGYRRVTKVDTDDEGFAIGRDRTIHQRAMTQWSSYLPTIGEGDRVPSAFVPELSRRARGVPVYAMLKTLGRLGVAESVEHHCALARHFAELLVTEPGVRVLNTVSLNQVIVSFGEGDAASRRAATEAVIARIQKGGVCFAAGAEWRVDWVCAFQSPRARRRRATSRSRPRPSLQPGGPSGSRNHARLRSRARLDVQFAGACPHPDPAIEDQLK